MNNQESNDRMFNNFIEIMNVLKGKGTPLEALNVLGDAVGYVMVHLENTGYELDESREMLEQRIGESMKKIRGLISAQIG